MGHDIHFLERLSRIEAEEESLALSLYLDPELVRTILVLAEFPDGADRVALALKNGPESPHIVVARDGGFVTCLGAGMSTGSNPVLTRHQLEGMRVRAERVRAALHLADSLIGDKNQEKRLLGRLMRVGDQATQDDYELMTTFFPLIGWNVLQTVLEQYWSLLDDFVAARHLLKAKKITRSADIEVLRNIYFKLWGVGHHLVIVASDPHFFKDAPANILQVFNPLKIGFYMCSTPMVFRGLWAASRFAPINLKFRQKDLEEAHRAEHMKCAAMSLTAAGCRHRKLRDEVERLLVRAAKASPTGMSPEKLRYRGVLLETCLVLLDNIPEQQEVLRFYRRAAEEEMAKDGSPVDELSDGLLRWALVSKEEPFEQKALKALVAFLPLVANFDGGDFFIPRGIDTVSRTHQVPLDAMLAVLREDVRCRGFLPVTRTSTPRRNDPCACGSGKKYKSCCAGNDTHHNTQSPE